MLKFSSLEEKVSYVICINIKMDITTKEARGNHSLQTHPSTKKKGSEHSRRKNIKPNEENL